MSFCPECGHQLKPQQRFCSKCGQTIEGATNGLTVTVQESTPPSKPLSKTQKILILASGVLVLLLVVAYFVLEHFTSVEYYLDRFEQAIEEKDEETLTKLIHSYDKRLDVTETNVKDFIAYVNDNPFYKEDMLDSLEDQAKQLDKPKVEPYVDTNVLLKKSGKQLFLFDDYSIQLLPYFLEVETNYAGAKIYINEKEVGESDSDYFSATYGPYLPGEYEIQVVYQSELATLDSETTVNLFETSGQNVYVDMWLEGYYVDVYANYEDTKLYIDGHYVGDVWDLGSIGPIDLDGSHTLYAEKEFPWGTVRSEEYDITDTYYDLYIDPLTDEMKNQVAEAIHIFETQRFQSLLTLDPSHIVATPEYTEDLSYDVQDFIDSDYVYYGSGLETVTVDLETMDIYDYEDYIEVVAIGRIDWIGDLYPAYYAEEEDPEFIEEISTEANNNMRSYSVLYDLGSQEWKVDSLYWSPYSEFEYDDGLVVFDVNQ